MHARSAKSLAFLFLLAVAGCSDATDLPPAPTASFTGTSPTTACDLGGIKLAYSVYLPLADHATAKTLVTQMTFVGPQTAAGRNFGFDLIALVASRVGQAIGTPAQGSTLVNSVLRCIFPPTDLPASFPVDFTAELDPAIDGAFAVRGPADVTDTPVLARGAFAFAGIAPPPGLTWTSILSERVLIYGEPSEEVPTTEDPVGAGFDWSMIRPNATFAAPGAVVGICIEAGADLLLLEEGVGVLAFQDPTYFLPCPNLNASLPGHRGAFAWLRAILAPSPLHAAAVANPGGTGGLAGGLRSIFGAVSIGKLGLRITQPPLDGRVGRPLNTVEVEARALGGTAMAGVRVSVRARLNNGSWVELGGVTELVTGPDGKARFNDLSLNKPGGYVLVATGTARSFTDHIDSPRFHIKK